ncbi:MAG TPA: hypothetical protein VL966_04075 [Alphaproteobacteria bacterium]|jgi:hypothetical protein|nr:hypothetical protein [Alphaproteobacteria bacterium]
MDTTTMRARDGHAHAHARPTGFQREWLKRALDQPGGKLPLFDRQGQLYPERTIRSCIEHGWAEAWFANPLKPDWMVCKITEAGRRAVSARN